MTNGDAADAPAVHAHRGFAGAYPENTVRAARAAAARDGVSMIEVDVVPTADGTVVCFHDDHLHRTGDSRGVTDAQGTVWETASETVLSATVLGTDATVPRFESVLDALPDGVGVNVELKSPGTTESAFATAVSPAERAAERRLWDGFVADVVECLDGFDGPVLASSFYEGAIAAVRERAPEIPVGILVWDSLSDGLDVARRYDAEAVHPPWNLVSGTPFAGDPYHLDGEPEVDVDVVAAAHDEGRAVNAWTVDTWRRADRLVRAGVDGLVADYPCIAEWTGPGTDA